MERITFAPLIEELKAQSYLYNELNKQFELTYGPIASRVVTEWMVEIVQPIIIQVHEQSGLQKDIHRTSKILYKNLLQLLGSGRALNEAAIYKAAWRLIPHTANVFIEAPEQLCSALDSAMRRLLKYTPDKASQWLDLMTAAAKEINTMQDFMLTGRLYAWFCGMAHLRAKTQADYPLLPESLQQLIIQQLPDDLVADSLFAKHWSKPQIFQGVAGGFVGWEGQFARPPKVQVWDKQIFVSDQKNCYAFFADRFGKTLLPANKMLAHIDFTNGLSEQSILQFIQRLDLNVVKQSITSLALNEQTAVYTVEHSHYLYTYSYQ